MDDSGIHNFDDDNNKFINIGLSFFRNLQHQIVEGKADQEGRYDIELAMEYFAYCVDSRKEIPNDLLLLISEILKRYEKYKSMSGALDNAIGFSGILLPEQTKPRGGNGLNTGRSTMPASLLFLPKVN